MLISSLSGSERARASEPGCLPISVRKVKRSLLTLREANDVRGVIGVLEVCLRPNFAGIERVQMYSEVSKKPCTPPAIP